MADRFPARRGIAAVDRYTMYRARSRQDEQLKGQAAAQLPAGSAVTSDASGSLLSFLPGQKSALPTQPPRPAPQPAPRPALDAARILGWVWAGRFIIAFWIIAGVV